MPKVLIVSDSHGLIEELQKIKQQHEVDYYIHCGDSELEYSNPTMDRFIKVGGNCDFDSRYPNEEVKKFGDFTFFITHGHLHQVKQNLMTIGYRAEECGAQIICFGHTHIAGVEKRGDQIFINPGSIRLPRNRREKTYVLLELFPQTKQVDVKFYTIDHRIVQDLSCVVSLDNK